MLDAIIMLFIITFSVHSRLGGLLLGLCSADTVAAQDNWITSLVLVAPVFSISQTLSVWIVSFVWFNAAMN